MQIITSDKIGLLKYVQCTTENYIFEQSLKPDLTRTINNVTWSGGYGGYEESQITVCRTNGLVESFGFSHEDENPKISDKCLVSFLCCNNCIYTKMLNHHHSIIYEDLFNTEKERYKNYSQFMPVYTNEKIKNGVYEKYLKNNRLLVTVSNSGHVHVLNWECDEQHKYHLSQEDEMKHSYDPEKKRNIYFQNYKDIILQNIEFKQIDEKNNSNNVIIKKNEYSDISMNDICKDYHYNNMLSEGSIYQSYILSNPIDAACINELLTNRLAIGGYKNCLKVFDLFTGNYIWKSKNIGTTLLNINCESLIKTVNFLNDINVNIISAATYDHKIILYDMRCQTKPVYIYDHYNRTNVSQNKFAYFNHNYSESDLVFTCISSNSHVTTEEYATKKEHCAEAEKQNGVTEKIKEHEQILDEKTDDHQIENKIKSHEIGPHEEIYAKFSTHQTQSKNLQIYEKLKEEKRRTGNLSSVNDYTMENEINDDPRPSTLHMDEDVDLPPPIHANELKCKNYFIKKFGTKDSQIIFVSDNYGNVYKFEVVTGIKLLQYIYMKKCAQEKITCEEEKKQDPIFLLKNKEILYEFYKEYQKNNKTHMRNDLPVMWAKDNFDQFLILFLNKFKIHNGAISSLRFHTGGKFLCSVSYDRFLSIFNTQIKKVIKRVHVGHILTNCLFRSIDINESECTAQNEYDPKPSKRRKLQHPNEESDDEQSSQCESWHDSSNGSDQCVSENGKYHQRNFKKRKGVDDEDDEDEDDDDEEEDDDDNDGDDQEDDDDDDDDDNDGDDQEDDDDDDSDDQEDDDDDHQDDDDGERDYPDD
ncbi:hypothetical protein, conserved [Plasmodium gonderi]|uniref:WD domain, G-beta repeat domain containing protein n=1 Tax=Plasmodium gonderi TaxID=77519 RepID=A0A1Y1JF76_PLAGO|nr:hypothetical protein, conserved [Plasmodium gonderi]GAW79392.1 hypothetical protein, conserved [Plasmodium gonderi]